MKLNDVQNPSLKSSGTKNRITWTPRRRTRRAPSGMRKPKTPAPSLKMLSAIWKIQLVVSKQR